MFPSHMPSSSAQPASTILEKNEMSSIKESQEVYDVTKSIKEKVKDINFTESDDEVQLKSEHDSKYELKLKAEEY